MTNFMQKIDNPMDNPISMGWRSGLNLICSGWICLSNLVDPAYSPPTRVERRCSTLVSNREAFGRTSTRSLNFDMDDIERSIRIRLNKYAERMKPPDLAREQLLAMAASKPVNQALMEGGENFWFWSLSQYFGEMRMICLVQQFQFRE